MNCIICGKELIPPQKKFCSKKCYRKHGNSTDRAKASRANWKANNPDVVKVNRADYHRGTGRITDYAWRKQNTDKVKVYKAKYRKTHAEKLKLEKSLYYKNNPEQKAIEKQRRRTAKKTAPVNFTKADWRAALEYFDNKCAYCGDPLDVPHREHFIALSNGGGFTKDNIVPACGRCNSRKGNKNPLDWLVMQAHGLAAYLRVKQYLDV